MEINAIIIPLVRPDRLQGKEQHPPPFLIATTFTVTQWAATADTAGGRTGTSEPLSCLELLALLDIGTTINGVR